MSSGGATPAAAPAGTGSPSGSNMANRRRNRVFGRLREGGRGGGGVWFSGDDCVGCEEWNQSVVRKALEYFLAQLWLFVALIELPTLMNSRIYG